MWAQLGQPDIDGGSIIVRRGIEIDVHLEIFAEGIG
jgi:hypothetical protein